MARTTIGSLGILNGPVLKLAMKINSLDFSIDDANQAVLLLGVEQEKVLMKILKQRNDARMAAVLDSFRGGPKKCVAVNLEAVETVETN